MTTTQWRWLRFGAGSATAFTTAAILGEYLAFWQTVTIGMISGILAAEYVAHRQELSEEKNNRR